MLDLTIGDGTQDIDIQITINNPWPTVEDLEDDDRWIPTTVTDTFTTTSGDESSKFDVVSGGSYFISMTGLTVATGVCSLIGRDDNMHWINIIGFVGPYNDGTDNCGVYFEVSEIIPDGTWLTFMLHDTNEFNTFSLNVVNPVPVWDDISEMESEPLYNTLNVMLGIHEHTIEYNSDPETDDEISFGTQGLTTHLVLLAGLEVLSGSCDL